MADKWWDSSSRRSSCLNSFSLTSINLFQDPITTSATASGGTGGGGCISTTNPTFQMMGLGLSTQPIPQSPDWNQDLFGGGQKNDHIGYQTLIQENQSLSSNTSPFELEINQWKSQKMYSIRTQDSSSNFKQINVRGFQLDQDSSFQNMDSYETPTVIQSLFGIDENNNNHQQQQQQQDLGFNQNEEMGYSSYHSPFWNTSAATMDDARSSFFPSLQSQLPSSTIGDHKAKKSKNTEMVKKGCSKSSSTKRNRNENQSPSPAFKVKKEKMGDRITALQQLVSPFGKTDTASVLSEAIEYIKFLHEQVGVLSTPYMKNGTPSMKRQQNSNSDKSLKRPMQELRSQGLCLVPVSSTFPVTHETTVDFWTPTFGATFP